MSNRECFQHDIRIGVIGPLDHIKSLQAGFAKSNIRIFEFRGNPRHIHESLSQYDIIQVTAFGASQYWLVRALMAKIVKIPIVRYWIGSDVLAIQKSLKERWLAKVSDSFIAGNVCQWHNLRNELRSLGIKSTVIPAPHPFVEKVKPIKKLPAEFTILSYLSPRNWELYGGDLILRVASENPQWRFLIVNHDGRGLKSPVNVKFLGFVNDMDDVYEQVSVLVRITKHDGLPRMILEALAKGLHVVWSQKLTGCHCATSHRELTNILKLLSEQPSLNTDGRDFVLSQFNSEILIEKWLSFYWSVIHT